ncbi:MAG: cation:proton antiporter [Clostridia bacterium]|nr:cation:proton antiporter [Clostridia bacterium]
MVDILNIGVALLAGLILSRLMKKLRLPAVTGYLIAGILIGPFGLGALNISGLGFNDFEAVDSLKLAQNIALGFIAFSIGNEFRLSSLKRTGKQATVIGIVQAVVAALFVDAALIGLHFIIPHKLSLSAAITLGAIATATAPATTLMVVRQYKAKGELTDFLLPIVALDDAVGLIIFAVSLGVARTLQSGTLDIVTILANPLIEIVLSLLLGAVLGVVLTWLERFFHSGSKRQSLCVCFVFLTAGLSMLEFHIGSIHISFSALLVCMMMGSVFCNLCDFSEELMERTDKWTAPLFILFFVSNGASLHLDIFTNAITVIIGATFIVFRTLGKYYGSYWSAKAVKCNDNVVKYLGITLLPQEGVALGMSLQAMALGAVDGGLIRNIVLFAVLIYALVSPVLSKIALTKAGDIVAPAPKPAVTRTKVLESAKKKAPAISVDHPDQNTAE